MAGDIVVSVLGPVAATVDGKPVALRPKEASVLGALALRPGVPVSAGRLAEAVWGETDEDLRPAVQIQVSRVRRALGSAAARIVTGPGGYRLDVDPTSVDAGRFEARAAEARAALSVGHHQETLTAASLDLALWYGTALSGAMEGWAAAEARRLEEGRLLAEEDRAEALVALDPALAAIDLEPLSEAEPLRERRWWLLASALAASGRRADALRRLNRARHILRDQLGVDPGLALVDLERQLLSETPEVIGPVVRRGWLPTPVTSLVGRVVELNELEKLSTSSRLITLTGTGGTGKTRLGLALAERLLATRPGGAWFVELDRLSDPHDVAGAVAATVAADMDGLDPITRAAAALGGGPAVVVLDSCEHVLDGAAVAATSLLAACRDLLVVATTRESLGVPGELTWVVPPLALEASSDGERSDALQLLAAWASAANPRLDLLLWPDAFNTIARAVDGLPLALELAAARLRAIEPDQLAEALSQHLGVLVGRARGGPARHTTMRAALDWGATACNPTELTVLARCSVFRGGFTTPAAIAVAGACVPGLTDSAVTRALEALVARSLVTPVRGRLKMLEPVRQWAEERLEAEGHSGAAIVAHGDWAVALAEAAGRRASRSPEPHDSATLTDEHANLIATVTRSIADGSDRALRIVGALGHTWAGAGRRDALSCALEALKSDRGVDSRVRSRALAAAAVLAGVVPDPGTAVALLREAVHLARAGTGRRQLGWAQFELGKAVMLGTPTEGDGPDEARQCFSDALSVFEDVGDLFGQAWCLANLGYLASSERDDDRAAALYDRAQQVGDAGPFPHVLAVLHRERAVLASRRCDHHVALAEASAAIDSYREQNDLWQLVNSLSVGAEVAWGAGELDLALTRADEAVAISSGCGFGDNIRLTGAWIAHRALEANLDAQARDLANLVVGPLCRRYRLWPATAAAITAIQARFPDLDEHRPAAPDAEVAIQARHVLADIRRTL